MSDSDKEALMMALWLNLSQRFRKLGMKERIDEVHKVSLVRRSRGVFLHLRSWRTLNDDSPNFLLVFFCGRRRFRCLHYQIGFNAIETRCPWIAYGDDMEGRAIEWINSRLESERQRRGEYREVHPLG